MVVTHGKVRLTVSTFRDGSASLYLETEEGGENGDEPASIEIVLPRQDVEHLSKRLRDHLERSDG